MVYKTDHKMTQNAYGHSRANSDCESILSSNSKRITFSPLKMHFSGAVDEALHTQTDGKNAGEAVGAISFSDNASTN